jgi:cysteine synthase A
MNGFGDHRIEGIGDKHVPWVHNVRNTDAVARHRRRGLHAPSALVQRARRPGLPGRAGGRARPPSSQLGLLGISGVCNLLAAIKAAKYWELNENDVIFTIFTDSVEMYRSRLEEQTAEPTAPFTAVSAAKAQVGSLERQGVDNFKELTFPEKKAIHNLKYYTWVEQQGKTYEEICAQWEPEYWTQLFTEEADAFDRLIEQFNAEVARS